MSLPQAEAQSAGTSSAESKSLDLAHQRKIVVEPTAAGETIEIRDAEGRMELSIEMTESGPKLKLEGISLQISGSEEISLSCQRLKIETAESAEIRSAGDLSLESNAELKITANEDDVRILGQMIYLN